MTYKLEPTSRDEIVEAVFEAGYAYRVEVAQKKDNEIKKAFDLYSAVNNDITLAVLISRVATTNSLGDDISDGQVLDLIVAIVIAVKIGGSIEEILQEWGLI